MLAAVAQAGTILTPEEAAPADQEAVAVAVQAPVQQEPQEPQIVVVAAAVETTWAQAVRAALVL